MYFEPTDELNEFLSRNHVEADAVSIWEIQHKFDAATSVDALIASVNEGLASARKVQKTEVSEVVKRAMERNATAFATPEVFEILVMREVSDFVTSSVFGSKPVVTDANNDLLPLGHPHRLFSSDLYSENFIREHQIEWKSSDPRVNEEYRPLVASAMRAPSNSLERTYVVAQLEATSPKDVPRDLIISIINDNQ
jgi:hypothetical protein